MNDRMHQETTVTSGKWLGPALVALAGVAASSLVTYRKGQEAERIHPPLGKFIEVDGVRLHYIERGQGDPLVLLHGDGAMAEDFELSGLPAAAAGNYRVISFDRPGYGYSQRPDSRQWTAIEQAALLRQALDQLGVQNPVVLGHSWGNFVALAMALEYPAYVKSLVLLSGYYYPSLRLDAELLATPALPVVGTLMRHTVSPVSGRMMWPGISKKLFAPAEIPSRWDQFPVWLTLRASQLKASAAESGMMVPSAKLLYKRYRELKMPILIMAGSGDRIVSPKKNAQRLHDELPHSELRIKEGIGHMIHYACADEIAAAIRSLK
ncbi:alpha/beta hydrolase [soil metagenome]